jgi:hypothetical protein
MPSVDEFILMRRATIGGALVEGENIPHIPRAYMLLKVSLQL